MSFEFVLDNHFLLFLIGTVVYSGMDVHRQYFARNLKTDDVNLTDRYCKLVQIRRRRV